MQSIVSDNAESALNVPAGDPRAGIEMRNLVKTFTTPAGLFTALKGVDVSFFPGEFVGVTGKSGSGKSTLANMITGIDRPTSGVVRVGDTWIQFLGESDMARLRGKTMGIVFQFYQLLPMLSLLENVMLPMDIAGITPPEQRKKRAMQLLDLVGLADDSLKMPDSVSGGQQQGTAIARALANDPPYLITDEPTGNLDSGAAENIFNLLKQLSRQGKTIVMITHDPKLAGKMDRQVVLSDGEIINPWVYKLFPMLTHSQMLHLTHNIQRQPYQPGEPIIHEGEYITAFYILSRGEVEVVVKDGKGLVKVITRLSAGDYFGEIELLEENRAIATVRPVSGKPVEVLAVKRNALLEVLREAGVLYDSMKHLLVRRRAENAAARSG